MNSNRPAYINQFYRLSGSGESVLLPSISSVLRNVILWSEYYLQSSPVASFPRGSPIRPMWVNREKWTPSNTMEGDMQLSMMALRQRIQDLEKEVRESPSKASTDLGI